MKLIRKFTKSGQTDLVYFTTQVRHERYTKDTSATRVKNFDFDNDTSENIFSYPKISYIANVRLSLIARRRTISFSELLFRNASFSCQNAFEKCTSKSELCNGKAYFKKLYSRLKLQMPLHVPA